MLMPSILEHLQPPQAVSQRRRPKAAASAFHTPLFACDLRGIRLAVAYSAGMLLLVGSTHSLVRLQEWNNWVVERLRV